MNELCLFAGAGGGLLGSKWLLGWRTICYVEIEPYAVACLVARIKDGLLDDAPIWDDARTFNGKPWSGVVDIVTAGFPCQPFSVAGKRKGAKDARNLWPDTFRIIREVRPRYVLLENVPGLLADKYVRRIFGDLAESGYDCRWRCLSAAEVGANHRRNRIWILANDNGIRFRTRTSGNMVNNGIQSSQRSIGERKVSEMVAHAQSKREMCGDKSENGRGIRINESSKDVADAQTDGWNTRLDKGKQGQKENITDSRNIGGSGEDVGDTKSRRFQKQRKSFTNNSTWPKSQCPSWWATEPRLGRVVDELANRLDEPKTDEEGEF